MKRLLPLAVLAFLSSLAWLPMGSASTTNLSPMLQDELLGKATLVFQRTVDSPSAAIPAAIMHAARAVAVVPAARRDGERHYGMGIVSARGADPQDWTPPAVVAFQGTIPVNLEVDAVDFVLLALTPRGLDHLSQAQPRVAPGSIFPGPIRQNTRVAIDVDLLAYMQFGDYLAGLPIEEWSIVGMKSANALLYGRPYSTKEILSGTRLRVPRTAQAWRNALVAYFREMS